MWRTRSLKHLGRHVQHPYGYEALKQQMRFLTLLEHHSHKLLQQYDVPVPDGYVVDNALDAKAVVSKIGAPSMLKSQILAGGRGKGRFDTDGRGGVRMALTPDGAFNDASNMLGHFLVTKQTPPSGLLVKELYIYRAVEVVREYYLSITFDRQKSSPVLLMSSEGGVNVESNADKLHRFWFSLSEGITPELIAQVRSKLLFSQSEIQVIEHIIQQMVKLFIRTDAILLELNPLALTREGKFICLDAKFDFDNSARFRQGDLWKLEERIPESEDEDEAARNGLVYVRLDGNIGNIVNGAGLAMATNDLINSIGGKSANFLDIGGKATTSTLLKAFEILGRDQRVRGVWINIFGGIVRCDMIAESILEAASAMGGFRVPVVVRLQGTNSEEALKMLETSGLDVYTETDFERAASSIVKLAASNHRLI